MSSFRKMFLSACLVACLAGVCLADSNVAIFDFQMKSDTPDWVWLEKGLADRMTTDFAQGRSGSVIARDRMETAAASIHWAAELSTRDPSQMKAVGKLLKIDTLVSGVYAVNGDQIEIIGQVIDVASRTELFRKAVAGPAKDVLELQRQLSAELIGYYSGRPAKEILPELPVWTTSLPAVKAVYEGMHLYDEGRYAEAWLKFRQASKEDPSYQESHYWVGKMYYFMNRYEHARRAMEKFIYIDQTHPRVPDAIIEYIHTYEQRGTPPEVLMELYQAARRRYTDTADAWLTPKLVGLLDGMGRYREIVELCDLVNPLVKKIAAADHNALTAETLTLQRATLAPLNIVPLAHAFERESKELYVPFATYKWPGMDDWVAFKQGSMDSDPPPETCANDGCIMGSRHRGPGGSMLAPSKLSGYCWMSAPSGSVFKSVRVFPVTQGGTDAKFKIGCGRLDQWLMLVGDPKEQSLDKAIAQGIIWDKLPSSGYVLLRWWLEVNDEINSPPVNIKGVRVVAQFEPMKEHGAIEVACRDTANFCVEVDGVVTRWYPGLVGPLSPGEHTLTFRVPGGENIFEPYVTKVNVQAGKTIKITGRIPWKEGTPWALWSPTVLLPDHAKHELPIVPRPVAVPRGDVYPQRQGYPAVLADNDGIRVVWSGSDLALWTSFSKDGVEYSAPARLPIPISSAWVQATPRLLRDESGRYILTFLSNRNARHILLPYICWSRDFVKWSAPSLIYDARELFFSYDIALDGSGRLIVAMALYGNPDNILRTLCSRDGYSWKPLCDLGVPESLGDVHLVSREDGQMEAFFWRGEYVVRPGRTGKGFTQIAADGRRETFFFRGEQIVQTALTEQGWSEPMPIDILRDEDEQYPWLSAMCPLRANGKTFLVKFSNIFAFPPCGTYGTTLYSQDADGKWRKSAAAGGLMPGFGAATFHPRWGNVICWLVPNGGGEWAGLPHLPRYGDGPFVVRTADIATAFGPMTPIKLPSSPQMAAASRPTSLPAGQLLYFASEPRNMPLATGSLQAIGEDRFEKPPAGCGTVHPKARVVTFKERGIEMKVAIDSDEAEAFNPLVRIDTTGKGDFHAGPVVKGAMGVGGVVQFAGTVELKACDRIVPVCTWIIYTPGANPQLDVLLGFTATASCQFGDQAHNVYLVNACGNLRLGNIAHTVLGKDGAYHAEDGIGKWVGDTVFVCDQPYVVKGNERFEMSDFGEMPTGLGFYGQPIQVDGKLWNISISSDGSAVSARPWEGATGNIRMPGPRWSAALVSKDKVMFLACDQDSLAVPVGEYFVARYGQKLIENGKVVCEATLQAGPIGELKVKEGATAQADFGQPYTGQIAVDQFDFTDLIRLQIDWKDKKGNVAQLHYLTEASPLSLDVFDADGKLLDRVTASYHPLNAVGWLKAWRPPVEVKNPITIKAPAKVPFVSEIPAVTVTLQPLRKRGN
jgi:TolB-like protein